MYRTLFDLAGLVLLGWIPLVLFPTWRGTRWLARSGAFAVWLAALYAVGILAVLGELGAGIIADFGSASGVLGLLRHDGLALVAWIHIMAFDHLVALYVYQDNMRHRYVPLPLQSVLLVFTFLLGPVGFLGYWLARTARRATAAPLLERLPVRIERPVATLALAAFALAALCALAAAAHGSWRIPPEGRLADALRFEVGVGIFMLTLALLLPIAGLSTRMRRAWLVTFLVNGVYFLVVEAAQALRGLDPRFTRAGTEADQVAGALFGVSALVLTALTFVLLARFFRGDVLSDRPALRTAIRYGALGIAFSFGVGVVMSISQGRLTSSGGSLMPLHAAGLHGIQAVPLVALLASAAARHHSAQRRLVHGAGLGWLVLCLGLFLQALAGLPATAPGAGNGIALAGAVGFAGVLGFTLVRWLRERTVTGRADDHEPA